LLSDESLFEDHGLHSFCS